MSWVLLILGLWYIPSCSGVQVDRGTTWAQASTRSYTIDLEEVSGVEVVQCEDESSLANVC